MIIHDVTVAGRRVAVRLEAGRIAQIAERLPGDGLDGHGAALLPGLHDHHLHLWATAAHRISVDCRDGLEHLADSTAARIRGVGYPGSVDRHALDALVADRPVRVQHAGGSLWMLNSAALAELGELADHPGVERDSSGVPTGRLWRLDELLRGTWTLEPDLEALGNELAAYGITSVTDATPGLRHPPPIRQHVSLLGPRKLIVSDHQLPSLEELAERIGAVHATGASVAVHTVTRASLLLTLAALDVAGRASGDRLEHAAIVPDPALVRGLRVVTQPGFLADRGDRYLREVEPDDLPHLYRFASLIEAGAPTVASSDAPYGPLDPWAVIRAARDRTIGPAERVSAHTALAGYLTDADFKPRRVAVGAAADLVLLHTSLDEALETLDAGLVRHTWIEGRLHGG